MMAAARDLQFELAARMRDEIADLKKELRGMDAAGVEIRCRRDGRAERSARGGAATVEACRRRDGIVRTDDVGAAEHGSAPAGARRVGCCRSRCRCSRCVLTGVLLYTRG